MIKEINKNDLKQALSLVNDVFSEFVVVDYSEQGKNTFKNYLDKKDEEVFSDLESGHKKMWGYFHDDKIIGVIATKDFSHIALMFVDKHHHRKGIAKKLFNIVLEELCDKQNAAQITVNSSLYAIAAYECLGFVKMGEQQEKDGIIYMPMKYHL